MKEETCVCECMCVCVCVCGWMDECQEDACVGGKMTQSER